jgi:hypothetical protein
MIAPQHDRRVDPLSNSDSSPAEPFGGRRPRRTEGLRYRPEIAPLEERSLLSTLFAVGSGVGDGTSHLYQISDYATAPKAVDIGSTGTLLTAIAISQQGEAAYGVTGSELYSVNLTSGKASAIGSLGTTGINALAISASGTLYGMGSKTTDLYTINPTTGHATVVFDTGYTSAGDLAFDTNGDLYLTTSVDLVRIALSDDKATDVGLLGVSNMFGLAVDSTGGMYGAEGALGGAKAILFTINKTTGAATKIGAVADASSLGVYGLSFETTATPTPTPTPTPAPTPTPTPTSTPTPISTPTPVGTSSPTPTPPGVTPPPAARPLPAGFLRTPPKVVGITTKTVDRTPEILIQLNQGIVPQLAVDKDRYRVTASGAEGALGTTSSDSHIQISRVIYRAKTDTITLVLPRKPKLQGNVVLTVDADGIVNLLGQALEGDSVNSGVNLIQEVDLP